MHLMETERLQEGLGTLVMHIFLLRRVIHFAMFKNACMYVYREFAYDRCHLDL